MPVEIMSLFQALAWPVAVLVAWWLGDCLHEWWALPKISAYAGIGVLAAWLGIDRLTQGLVGLSFLANVTLSLVLFELGHRINLRWFLLNPWLLVTGLTESALMGFTAWHLSSWFPWGDDVRLIVAAMAMTASPAAMVRGVNELRAAGQVTERALHLCAIHSLLSVVAMQLIIGYWHLSHAGDWVAAVMSSLHTLMTSVALGATLAVVTPWLLRRRGHRNASVTVLYALLVLMSTALSYTLKLSPLLTALVFGLVIRERRTQLNSAKRDFGSIGELLGVFLFVYVPSLLHWPISVDSLLLGLLLVAARTGIHAVCNVALARLGGITWRKGLLTALALSPMSAYAILLLAQSKTYGLIPADTAMDALTGLLVLLEVLGPIVTQYSLGAASEVPVGRGRS